MDGIINKLKAEVYAAKTIELDRQYVRGDCYEYLSDVLLELEIISPDHVALIYEYNEAHKQEQALFNADDAFEAGRRAGIENNFDAARMEEAYMEYIQTIYKSKVYQKLFNTKSERFYEICGLLGANSGLMEHYKEVHVRCNSLEACCVDVFFDAGYQQAAKDCLAATI